MDVYAFLADCEVPYQRVDHPPVFTVAEAEEKVPPLPGVHTKNLFLRDGKGRRHFLVIVDGAMQVDLKALRGVLGADKLGMASPERLDRYLGVAPGAVTLLGVLNDAERAARCGAVAGKDRAYMAGGRGAGANVIWLLAHGHDRICPAPIPDPV